jgi:hypothetical protein
MLIRNPSTQRAVASFGLAGQRFHSAVQSALTDIGKKNVGDTRAAILSRKKTGRIYSAVVRGKRVRHRASAPGEVPANLSGDLQRSIAFIVNGGNQMTFGANTKYARWLEEGTKNMAPRPYMIKIVGRNLGYAYNRLSGYVLAELIQ